MWTNLNTLNLSWGKSKRKLKENVEDNNEDGKLFKNRQNKSTTKAAIDKITFARVHSQS